MKTVYLLRHADAEPIHAYDDDHERELSANGRRDANRLGAFLDETGQVPDQFVSSTAVRARRTVELLADAEARSVDVPFRSTHALYRAEPADVLQEVHALDASLQSVMVVGHEPAWSTTVSRLVGSANVSLSPGACVRIDTEQSWADLQFGGGILRWMVPPTLLRA